MFNFAKNDLLIAELVKCVTRLLVVDDTTTSQKKDHNISLGCSGSKQIFQGNLEELFNLKRTGGLVEEITTLKVGVRRHEDDDAIKSAKYVKKNIQ